MKTVKSKITYTEKASRLELFVRIIYMIPIMIVLWIFGIIAAVVFIVEWLHILILGKRHKSLGKFLETYVTYVFKVNVYLNLVTDERPPIIPEEP